MLNISGKIIDHDSDCFVVAEIGSNHQGSVDICKQLFKTAAECGVDAVKLQKRDNKTLFTKDFYNKEYNSENAYGPTYGLHREALEFGEEEYVELKRYADELGLILFSTPFDFNSADFLNALGLPCFKIASCDLTNTPLLRHVARFGKPIIISTGAAQIDDVRRAYEAVRPINGQIAFLQCTATYPTDPSQLDLNVIKTYQREFPEAVAGLSDHYNGIALDVAAYILGARIIEKHLTLNRSMRGTDHAFSLEPVGMKKLVRDLQRTRESLGNGVKKIYEEEKRAIVKMTKKIVAARDLPSGTTLTWDDLAFKSPGDGLLPYFADDLIGKRITVSLSEDEAIGFAHLQDAPVEIGPTTNNEEAISTPTGASSYILEYLMQSNNPVITNGASNYPVQTPVKENSIAPQGPFSRQFQRPLSPLPIPHASAADVGLVVFDFDGVFTNNVVWMTEDGQEMVQCSRGDGIGLARLRDAGIAMHVLSSEVNPIVEKRCRKMGIACTQGVLNKGEKLLAIMASYGAAPERTAFVGNDINDLSCLKAVGMPIIVQDAHPETVQAARYQTTKAGGHGAVREICDWIIACKNGTAQ